MLPEVVDEAARRFGDRAAFVAPDGAITNYRDLSELSVCVAVGMLDAGVEEGDVVVLRLPSEVSYAVAYVAAARLGAITAGINPWLAPAEQDQLEALVSPKLTLTETAQVDGLRCAGGFAPLDDDPERDVCIVFTSGTTGIAKGAVFKNRQLAAITQIDVGDRWDGGGPMLAGTQFAHIGFMTKFPWYVRTGATIHLLDKWRAGDVLRIVSESGMASVGGVAAQMALMLRSPEIDQLDFSAVKTIVMGGSASPPALVAEAREKFGATYSIRYSSTESGGVGTGTAFDADDDEALHTVGRPRAGVEVEIRDENDQRVSDGEIGEVCLRSGAVMDRYWNDLDATTATLKGDWLHSGDLGFFDERGLLRLAGRSKEMFIRGGYNVYPAEVEAQLLDHPLVREVAVVPKPDDVMGEIGVACVIPVDPGSPPTLDDLRTFLEDRLARFKHPEDLVLVDDLPLTPGHKLDRKALERQITD